MLIPRRFWGCVKLLPERVGNNQTGRLVWRVVLIRQNCADRTAESINKAPVEVEEMTRRCDISSRQLCPYFPRRSRCSTGLGAEEIISKSNETINKPATAAPIIMSSLFLSLLSL